MEYSMFTVLCANTYSIDAIPSWTSGRITSTKLGLSSTPLIQPLAVFDHYHATRVSSIHVQVSTGYMGVEAVLVHMQTDRIALRDNLSTLQHWCYEQLDEDPDWPLERFHLCE